jgi:hypothetical protein
MADFKATLVRDADGTTAGVESRKQTPTKTGCMNVMIGPGDPISNIPVVIDYAHHQNHEGEAYLWFYYNAALNGTVNLRLSVPALLATKATPHMLLTHSADTTSNVYLYEGPTVTAPGTESTTVRNRNRNSANVPGMKIYTGATFSADGVLLYHGVTVAAAKASISSDTTADEWILKTSTDYLIRIVTTGASIVMLRIYWYEDLGV